MRVTRTLYEKSPRRGYAVILGASYDGPGLRRRETLMYECEGRDDLPFTPRERTSEDNGRTWTDWKPLPETVDHQENRWNLFGLSPVDADPATGLTLGVGLRQTVVEQPVRRWYNHTYWALSSDGGRTWGEPRQFRYEEGAVRDPANPLDPAFLEKNRAYPGSAIRLSDGSVLLACTAVNVPDDAPDTDPTGEFTGWDKAPHARDIGACCFRGRWDRAARTVEWRMSNRVWVPLSVSCRGLAEAMPVELADGRILVVCRGTGTRVTPGRKWCTVSADGGLTLGPIGELRYDDGSRFYSPSSIHGFIRHSMTGTLYWIANITADPPDGNRPRYPLVIAEVDEAIPAIRRSTVTVIDDRRPGEGKMLALSNFSVFENRETHSLELYLSRYSASVDDPEKDPEGMYDADGYRYVIEV